MNNRFKDGVDLGHDEAEYVLNVLGLNEEPPTNMANSAGNGKEASRERKNGIHIPNDDNNCLFYIIPTEGETTLPRGNQVVYDVMLAKLSREGIDAGINAVFDDPQLKKMKYWINAVFDDPQLKNMNYWIKYVNGQKKKFPNDWKNCELTLFTYARDQSDLKRWLKPYFARMMKKAAEEAEEANMPRKRRGNGEPKIGEQEVAMSDAALNDEGFQALKKLHDKVLTEFGEKFESIRRPLEALELAQVGQNREQWTKRWAVARSSSSEQEKNWAADLNDYRRSVTRKFLFPLCDAVVIEGRIPKEAMWLRFHHEIFRILSACLLMDKWQALLGLTDYIYNFAGKAWYAEETHTQLMKDIGAIAPDYNGQHTMNRRYVWLFDSFKDYPNSNLHLISSWIVPTLCPRIVYPKEVLEAARECGVNVLDDSALDDTASSCEPNEE